MASPWALVAMCAVGFFSYLAVGMLAPFLPQHLTSMGLDESWSGIIFACYPIAMIMTTPTANALVAGYGRLPLIFFGLAVQSVSAFAFGRFGSSLLVLLVSRFTQGLGASASNLAVFSLVADLYEDSLGRVMGLNELFIGAGFSVGPLFGALLYSRGGFSLPFIVCSVQLAVIAALTPLLRGVEGSGGPTKNCSSSADQGGGALSRLWRACTLKLLLPAGLLMMGTMVWGIIDSGFYTVHAVSLGLDQNAIGVNLAAASGAYAGIGFLVGAIADRIGYGTTMIVGSMVSATSLLLLGPAALPACASLVEVSGLECTVGVQQWWEFVVLILLGFGQAQHQLPPELCLCSARSQAGMLIPSLGAMKSSVPSGNATATESCVSLFNGFQQAGLVLGPLASSVLGTRYDLGNSAVAVVLLAYGTCFWLAERWRRRGKAGLNEPLLFPPSPAVMLGAPVEYMTPPMSQAREQASGKDRL